MLVVSDTSPLNYLIYLYATESEAAARADARQVEREIRAQIARARAFGLRPTHLDSHMGTSTRMRRCSELSSE